MPHPLATAYAFAHATRGLITTPHNNVIDLSALVLAYAGAQGLGGATVGWRLAVATLTFVFLAAALALLLSVLRAAPRDGFEDWRAFVAAGGLLLGAAIGWQGLPALFG